MVCLGQSLQKAGEIGRKRKLLSSCTYDALKSHIKGDRDLRNLKSTVLGCGEEEGSLVSASIH